MAQTGVLTVAGLRWALLTAASLLLLPALTDALGRRRGWQVLATGQLLAGGTLLCALPGSGALLSSLITAALGLSYLGWRSHNPLVWVLVGLSSGLAALADPSALAFPLVLSLLGWKDVLATMGRGRRASLGYLAPLGLGLLVGLLPELLGLLPSTAVPAEPTVAQPELPGPIFGRAVLAHALQLCLLTFGAPLLLCALLLGKRLRPSPRLGSAHRRTLAALGGALAGPLISAAVLASREAVLHPEQDPADLFPSLLEPYVLPTLLLALAGAGAWTRHRSIDGLSWRSRLQSLFPWLPLWGLLALAVGPLAQWTGWSLPPVEFLTTHFADPIQAWFVAGIAVVVLAICASAFAKRRLAGPGTVAAAATLSWLLALPSVGAAVFWGELPLNPSTGLSSSSPYDDPKLMLHDTLPPQAVRREGPLPSADLEGQAGAPTGTDMENDAAAAERTQVPGTTEEGLTAEAGEVGTEGTADVVLDEPDGVEIIEGMEGLEGFEDFVGGEGDPTGAQEEGDLNAETLEDETTALEALDEPQTESEAVALLDGGREALPPAGGPADAPPSGPEVALSIPRLEEAAGQGLWLVVRKSERRIDVVSPPEPDGEVVATFEVNLGFAPEGDKVRQGDGKTPEGEFQVTARHPESRFYRAFLLSYPAEEDIERGLQDGLITSRQADRLLGAHVRGETPPFDTPLGGLIEIHGMRIEGQPTRGCVAISNREIDALWPHVRPGTRVTILP